MKKTNEDPNFNIVHNLTQKGVKEIIDLKIANDNKHDESKHKKKVCIFWMQG